MDCSSGPKTKHAAKSCCYQSWHPHFCLRQIKWDRLASDLVWENQQMEMSIRGVISFFKIEIIIWISNLSSYFIQRFEERRKVSDPMAWERKGSYLWRIDWTWLLLSFIDGHFLLVVVPTVDQVAGFVKICETPWKHSLPDVGALLWLIAVTAVTAPCMFLACCSLKKKLKQNKTKVCIRITVYKLNVSKWQCNLTKLFHRHVIILFGDLFFLPTSQMTPLMLYTATLTIMDTSYVVIGLYIMPDYFDYLFLNNFFFWLNVVVPSDIKKLDSEILMKCKCLYTKDTECIPVSLCGVKREKQQKEKLYSAGFLGEYVQHSMDPSKPNNPSKKNKQLNNVWFDTGQVN